MSRHTVLGWVLFSGECGPGEYGQLGFLGFSLILHLAHHVAKFRRSCCKSFVAKRTFKVDREGHI